MTTVKDFLTIAKENGSDLLAACQKFQKKEELMKVLFDIIENSYASELSDSVCEALFTIYSTQQQECMIFSLQFVPALLWAYYSCLSRKVKWNASKIEVVLLLIYNEVVEDNISKSFCIPTLSKVSIYHEPHVSLGSTLMLTEHSLSQHEKSDQPILLKSPSKFLDRIPAGYRSLVTQTVLHQYNVFISSFTPASLLSQCNMIFRLSRCGYKCTDSDYKHISIEQLEVLDSYPKVNLSYNVINEMVVSLHFISYNGFIEDTVSVLKQLHQKACYTLCPAGMLMTQSLLNLIDLSCNVDTDAAYDILPPINPKESRYRGPVKLTNQTTKTIRRTAPPPTLNISVISPEPKITPNRQPAIVKCDGLDIQLEKHTITVTDHDSITPVKSPLPMTSPRRDGVDQVDPSQIDIDNIKMSLTSTDGNSKNLHSIEKELIEYTKNNDKTPLINSVEEGEGSDSSVQVIPQSQKLSNSSENLQKTHISSPDKVETQM